MSYFQTQLETTQAQEFFIGEFNKALTYFSRVETIPAKLEIYYGDTCMEQLIRVKEEYYLVALETLPVKEYVNNSRNSFNVYSRQVRIRHLDVTSQPNLFSWKVFVGPSDCKDLVYEGQKLYCCLKPKFARGISMDDFENSIWYFSDFETPNRILEKISNRLAGNDINSPIITIKLKKTPFRGFKKNVVYKKYSNTFWTLTNKNGRVATEYDLLK